MKIINRFYILNLKYTCLYGTMLDMSQETIGLEENHTTYVAPQDEHVCCMNGYFVLYLLFPYKYQIYNSCLTTCDKYYRIL